MNGPDVTFQNFKGPYLELKQDLDQAYHRFMESGDFVPGKETSAFEEEYAACCLGVANGLDALHLSLLAVGVGPCNEVIVRSNTYLTTWLAVTLACGIPIPVEPDPHTYYIDATRIEQSITAKTRAILAGNLYGQPYGYHPTLAIANKYGL